jgi:hypothetical protein
MVLFFKLPRSLRDSGPYRRTEFYQDIFHRTRDSAIFRTGFFCPPGNSMSLLTLFIPSLFKLCVSLLRGFQLIILLEFVKLDNFPLMGAFAYLLLIV